MSSNILVTGAAGFTGSALVDRLIEKGHKVTGLAHVNKGYSEETKKHSAKIVFGSVTDKELVNNLIKDADYVFHIAAAFRTVSSTDREYYETNVTGTKYLVEAALKHKIKRFIHCSTCGVHGEPKKLPADENSPLCPLDYYQQTKMEGELVVQKALKKGLKGVVIRPCGIYGPRDTRLLKIFKTIAQRKFIMFGTGNVKYQLVYIDNLLDAFELAMTHRSALGKTFLIADEHSITLNQLVNTIAEEVGVKTPRIRLPVWPLWLAGLGCEMVCKPFRIEPPLFRRRVNFFIKNRAFNIAYAKSDLGYKPKVGFEEGIKKTISWYKEKKLI